MSDIVKWMRSINDGSALAGSLREVRELKAEVERLKGVLGPVLEIAERNEPGLATQAAREALEAKP